MALGAENADTGLDERFSDRARALFYARLALLTVGLALLSVPSWSRLLGTTSRAAFAVYFFLWGYSVANFLLLDHPRFGRPLTFATLVLDLGILSFTAHFSGGLASPLLAAHVMFTVFFFLLFPRVTSLIPPILSLPILAGWPAPDAVPRSFSETLFLVLWYAMIAAIVAYVLLYLNARDAKRTRQLRALTKAQEASIVAEERLRLAREIHDGLGGALSTLIIEAEFIGRRAEQPDVKEAIAELKGQAEEAIDELRRSLTMMRRDFDLHTALEEQGARFADRARCVCEFKVKGKARRLPSEMQLTIFRILQECLTNAQKHASAERVDVRLKYDGDIVSLTVADDGRGFDPGQKRPGHYGLENIEARSKKFRGTVDVQSAQGAGTTIHVALVVPDEGSHIAIAPVLA